MNNYAASRSSLSLEEKVALIEERSHADVESESGGEGLEVRSSPLSQRVASYAAPLVKGVRLSSYGPSLLRLGVFLLPSFVQHRVSRERWRSSNGDNGRVGPTAYLDGMRGLAALFVFFCHYTYGAFVVGEGWGHGGSNYEVFKLPFVRLLFSGPTMVCLFFVISGYALSLKPLRQMRGRAFDGLAATMSSFVFRRGFRLFLPTTASTFMVLVLIRLGAYEQTRGFAGDRTYMRGTFEYHPEHKETLLRQLEHWGVEMFNFVHVWSWEKFGGSTQYDVHLWTIPVEFRCALALFLVQLGTARLRTSCRLVCLAGLMWFTLVSDRWEMFLFLAGMLFAEMDLIRGAHEPPPRSSALLPVDEKPSAPRTTRPLLYMLLSIPALYFMSCPDNGPDDVPGWRFLGSMIPAWFTDKYRFWQVIGSVLFVFCVGRAPAWQKLFNTSIIQYFGRISYALYLMHGPYIHTAGYMVEGWAWDITGTEDWRFDLGFVLAGLVNTPLTIWISDVFWRAVDAPTVRFAKWLEAKCSI